MYGLIHILKDNPTENMRDGTLVSYAGSVPSAGVFDLDPKEDYETSSPVSFDLDAEQNETSVVKLAVRTSLGYMTSGTTRIVIRDDPDAHLSLCKEENGSFSSFIDFKFPAEQIRGLNKIFYLKAVSRSDEYPTVDLANCLAIIAPINGAEAGEEIEDEYSD